jgi:hypothetical protein
MFQLTQFFVILVTVTNCIKLKKIFYDTSPSEESWNWLGSKDPFFICKRSRGNVATQRIL